MATYNSPPDHGVIRTLATRNSKSHKTRSNRKSSSDVKDRRRRASKTSGAKKREHLRDSKLSKSDNLATQNKNVRSKKADEERRFHKPSFVRIDEHAEGQRLDNYLFKLLKGVPKGHVYRIIRSGEVRINKGRVKQTTRLKEGDSLRLPPIQISQREKVEPEGHRFSFLTDRIIFEDESLIILNKPSGMAVHAGSGIKIGLIEAFRAVRPDLKFVELVHRLDRETSGCLVLAKKAACLKTLQEDFRSNSQKNSRLDKRYWALVSGDFGKQSRKIVKPLNTQARKAGERHVVVDEQGSYASSITRTMSRSTLASLIEVKILTGKTHQVRVHCLSEGHPLAGDTKYGDKVFNQECRSFGLKRLFLHAARLSLHHPVTKQRVDFEAPLDDELQSVIEKLDLCIN